MEPQSHTTGEVGEPIRKKRNRVAFSCTNCRHSKQRCNRGSPCMTCVLRGKQDSCRYTDDKSGRAWQDENSEPKGRSSSPESSPPKQDNPDLSSFGYSDVNAHNVLGIVKKLEHLETGNTHTPRRKTNTVSLSHASSETYRALIKRLPCRTCVEHLVQVFFTEVNWQFAIVDRNIFDDQLTEYYRYQSASILEPQDQIPTDQLTFPALLFQVIGLAVQFLPAQAGQGLHSACLRGIPRDGKYDLQGCHTMQLLNLVGKNAMNLTYIQAEFLRISWLKNCGFIAEAWHALAQTIMDAQDIGLHRDDFKVDASDAEEVCEQLWQILLRRRTMMNLYLWDSEMGIVLGKSFTITLSDCNIVPPTDCDIPTNRRSTAPLPRALDEKPNEFTLRFLESRLTSNLHEVKALEAEGPYPRDYSKVERLHQQAIGYIDSMPAIYRSEFSDTSYDLECPWLPAQREYLCSGGWLFVLLIHRTYLFSIPKSREAIMRAGIEALRAQQRFFILLQPHHHKLFTLTYLSAEPAISMLAVLITFPEEHGDLVEEAFRCIREALWRLNQIRGTNNIAGPGANVIQNLLGRAELKHKHILTGNAESLTTGTRSSDLSSVTQSPHQESLQGSSLTSENADQQAQYRAPQFLNMADWSSLSTFQQANTTAQPAGNTNYALNESPLRPLVDLAYHDLTTSHPFELGSQGTGSVFDVSMGSQQMAAQFQGTFDDNSFWNFMNTNTLTFPT
ncbi:hypothetical protein EDD37DRAFT_59029 [Exophiala viscosa]|uniref:uncharacterized protein n=1 Tax=Exophiala viscosa TaxID=2486360 RepID=UPI002191C9AA|nr:hypothetical protein EDD37DRAFT_59029 [Exophiala viscosa]